MLKIKRIIIFLICILALCGCENKKCINSHIEKTTCLRFVLMPNSNGEVRYIYLPVTCDKEICDEYEKVGE